MDHKLSDFQVAFFVSNIDFSDRLALAKQFASLAGGVFNGEPAILPVPNDAPPEIPRIILQSKNNSFRLNIAANRIDFYFAEKELVELLPTKDIRQFSEFILPLLKELGDMIVDKSNYKIIRLGFLPTFVIPKMDGASEYFRVKLLNESMIPDNLDEAKLSFNKRIDLDKYVINFINNVTVFRMADNKMDNKALIYNIDINTIPEKQLNITSKELNQFFINAFLFLSKKTSSFLKI